MKRRVRATAAALPMAAALSLGCEYVAPSEQVERASQAVTTTAALPRAEYHLTLTYPKDVNPLETAVAASGVLKIGSFAKVLAASGHGAITNMGAGTTTIEADGQVGTASSLSKLVLRDRAQVNGDLTASALEQGNNTIVTGSISNDLSKLRPPRELKLDVVFPAAAAAPSISLDPDQTESPAPGRYGTIRAANATVKLRSGVYYVDVLQFEAGSRLELDQSAGPVTIYVQTRVVWRGRVIVAAAPTPNLLVAYVGSENVYIEAPFRGALLAPAASVTFQGTPGEHRGTFLGRNVAIEANQKIILTRTDAQLTTVDAKSCVSLVLPRADLSGDARQIAYQRDLFQYCLSRNEGQPIAHVRAVAANDRVQAAAQVAVGVAEPNVYIGVLGDRQRKVKEAVADSAIAQALAAGLDQDKDLVPDDRDICINTPLLTPTDAQGCPVPLPPGPAGTDVRDLLARHWVAISMSCKTGRVRPLATPGAFFWPSDPSKGVFWVTSRVEDQDPGCTVWYEIEIKGETPDGKPAHLRVMFNDTERQTTNLVGMSGRPVPADYAQFQVLPSNTGVRGRLANDLKPYRGRFRARAMNSAGVQSSWTDWRSQTPRDCLSLGFSCGG